MHTFFHLPLIRVVFDKFSFFFRSLFFLLKSFEMANGKLSTSSVLFRLNFVENAESFCAKTFGIIYARIELKAIFCIPDQKCTEFFPFIVINEFFKWKLHFNNLDFIYLYERNFDADSFALVSLKTLSNKLLLFLSLKWWKHWSWNIMSLS